MKEDDRSIPAHPSQWLQEIARAYRDAREAVPFGDFIGHPFGEAELFHLAPLVCLKFRGLPLSGPLAISARDGALASYVATMERGEGDLQEPRLAFAFCYLASHYSLDLVTEDEVDELMTYVEEHQADLARLTDPGMGGAA